MGNGAPRAQQGPRVRRMSRGLSVAVLIVAGTATGCGPAVGSLLGLMAEPLLVAAIAGGSGGQPARGETRKADYPALYPGHIGP